MPSDASAAVSTRPRDGPRRRIPIRFDSGRTSSTPAQNAGARVGIEEVLLRSRHRAQDDVARAPAAARSRGPGSGGANGSPTARTSPFCRRRPWNPPKRAETHVERLPSTFGTSIPPATATTRAHGAGAGGERERPSVLDADHLARRGPERAAHDGDDEIADRLEDRAP